ncbi:alanine/glycine:cation symporter family protein [Sinanaerobacter sp. ZZT-01]|uniref:alanine/glycine:cation symporter family protein n=1 Tax=Sinanaerobacter sp. ZZT-01 TaxID=3111540 RepID=UPI002D779C64|nr:alanine/glycine:cation symporter family protein [Sinanaerobacter sp. ZZT-01]WRR92334.1 alanine/glycine:cation symporter family protein [Sinanaerobacter sp. ZZT-01]
MMEDLVQNIHMFALWMNRYLWGVPMLILLFGTHIYMTFRTGVIQQKIFQSIRLSVTKDTCAKGDVSQFGALATALASTIGTGNIVGVGTAIALGGPGAVFWTWLTGCFGIATKYSEALIAIKYRVQTKDGSMLGGAMYALERGLQMKWLAVLFAFFTALAGFGIGSSVQANAVSVVMKENFNIPEQISGVFLAALVAVVILGGVQSITKVCEKLVPFMALFYTLGCIFILIINKEYLMQSIETILLGAFSKRAAGGGFVGSTILIACRYGVARGLFSNESGMGSAPIVAAAAQTRNPVRQAMISSTATFWDTGIVCGITGLVLVSTIIANPQINAVVGNGGQLTSLAFEKIPYIGSAILAFGMLAFAFSTILGWSYYGEKAAQYLFGKKIIFPYRIAWIAMVFIGAISNLDVIWSLSDMMNALMAIPNLIAILLLSHVIAKETQYYVYEDHLDEIDQTPIPIINR